MDSGRLNNQIILKRKTITRDAIGGEIVTYVNHVTVMALAEPIRSGQYESQNVLQSDTDIKFTIYYREDVQSDWRVEWRNQDYEIVGPPVDVTARKQWMELMVKTVQS